MNLAHIIEQAKNCEGPIVKFYHQGESFRVLVMGFKSGMIFKGQQTNASSKLVVLEGCVIYKKKDAAVVMNQFDDINIAAHVPHTLEAVEDSICFLIQS